MNSNWRNRPTSIEKIGLGEFDFSVFFDESGNSNLKSALEAKRKKVDLLDDNEGHFTLAAVLFSNEEIAAARDSIMRLKREYWPDGKFAYPNGIKRVQFHSHDIRNRKGPFR